MLESIKKNKKGIILMIISSICACIGQMLWKMSADKGLIYMSLNYVLSIVLAAIVLGEKVGFVKCIGVLVIIAGVIMIAGGDTEEC